MDHKVVVITGASSGIGAALAKFLGAQGHAVVLAARREQQLREVAAQAESKTLVVVTDVTRRADIERLKDSAIDKFGRVDVWINNAGRGIGKPVLELSDDDFDEIINVNLRSALYGMQAIVPYFQSQGHGHVINISSALGRVPLVGFRSIYNAAKAGLNSLTANLRMDLQAKYPDIHVSLVMPGVVLTPFHENALGGTPRLGQSAGDPRGQSADEVAAIIASLIEKPQAELYTNPGTAEMVRRYFENVEAFEQNLLNRD